jgi:hypothetical protein
METLLSSDFWFDQIAAVLKAWVILVPLSLVLWVAFKIKLAKTKKEMCGLRAYTEAVDCRLQLARDLNAGEAEAIAEIRAEVDALRQLIKAKARRSTVEPILKEVDAAGAILAMTNCTTNHVLTAKELAIGGLEEKQKLRLVPRRSE